MDEVRRDDDRELCGFVEPDGAGWVARTVFGVPLGTHADRAGAVAQVRGEGLAVLAERWTLRDPSTGVEEVVCIQEADPDGVTVALGPYSLPGVPTQRLTAGDLRSGRWELHR